MAITLYALLADRPRQQLRILLSSLTDDDQQAVSPLLIAARNGHERVVRVLLDKFHPDLEQEGRVKFDGYIIDGASALWCAAGAGHLNIVKILVKKGANVNHVTKTNSTPLRAACFDGRFDIVQFLIENNADLHISNKYNNTCLMIAAYKGYLSVVEYLLEKGANPNVKALCGATAMHFAAESGHVAIIEALIRFGAVQSSNEHNMTPLLAAAERTKKDVVSYLIGRPDCTKEKAIEALELLGASYANDKDDYSPENAFKYMMRAMKERFSDPDEIIHKPQPAPIPAYQFRRECQTIEELQTLKNNSEALHMEGLVIRERILGPHNPEVPHPIIFRGAVFADSARFDYCISLWLHALHLRQYSDITVMKDLLRFAQVFSQMLHVGVEIPYSCVQEVLQCATVELERNVERLRGASPDDRDSQREEMDCNMHTVLYLLVAITKLFKFWSIEQEHRIYCTVYRLAHLPIQTCREQTLLHLVVNPTTLVDDFHTNDICHFPCAATAKLLLQCGADPNVQDAEKNTPLHVIVAHHNPISDFLTLHTIILALIEAGAHIDIVNSSGETPFESSTSVAADIIFRTQGLVSLKCLSARAIVRHKIPYRNHVLPRLRSFIELHGTVPENNE